MCDGNFAVRKMRALRLVLQEELPPDEMLQIIAQPSDALIRIESDPPKAKAGVDAERDSGRRRFRCCLRELDRWRVGAGIPASVAL